MIGQSKVDGITPFLLTLEKQLRFAVAVTATAVAKEAQAAAIRKIEETFITRSQWYAPTNYYGVHFKPATVEDPSSEVSTNAYWLIPHEEGALKTPHGGGQFLAIPTEEIQPNIRQTIPRSQRPRNLANAFILPTSAGPKLFERINNQLRVVYNLVRQVRIAKQSTIIQPTIETVQNRFAPILGDKLQEAIRTAK